MKSFSRFIIISIFILCTVTAFGQEQSREAKIRNILAEFPGNIQTNIKSNMAEFMSDLDLVLQEDMRYFKVVDKQHPLPSYYNPGTLVDLDSTSIRTNKKGMQLEKMTYLRLKDMVDAAEKEGLFMLVSSAYRSYDYQTRLYNYYVKLYGKEETDTFSAAPGTSQHQLGTVVDFGTVDNTLYYTTREGKWLRENAWKYGFSLSFPNGYEDVTGYSWESWHYRYVTYNGVAFQKKYFDDIQHYMLRFLDLYRS